MNGEGEAIVGGFDAWMTGGPPEKKSCSFVISGSPIWVSEITNTKLVLLDTHLYMGRRAFEIVLISALFSPIEDSNRGKQRKMLLPSCYTELNKGKPSHVLFSQPTAL